MSSTTKETSSSHNPFSPPPPGTPTKVYKGGCHCGKFEFECRHPVLEDGYDVVSCNCSICTQRGYLLIYILDPKDFTLIKGSEAELTRYQFNTKFNTHLFCPVCGSGMFTIGEDTSKGIRIIIVNARTISDLDIEKLTLKKVDGRTLL
ncbi:Mss4-like protein [Gautieria morchelliformis]|nr:Mss4-like protein [Gautieria morchelliformis]